MNAPAKPHRHWLRTRGEGDTWHMVVCGERVAECGAELSGAVSAARLPPFGLFLPEPNCICCVFWLRGDIASAEGPTPRL